MVATPNAIAARLAELGIEPARRRLPKPPNQPTREPSPTTLTPLEAAARRPLAVRRAKHEGPWGDRQANQNAGVRQAARLIARELGKAWGVEYSEGFSRSPILVNSENGTRISMFDTDGNRYAFRSLADSRKLATVTDAKPLSAIARELERRLIPDATEAEADRQKRNAEAQSKETKERQRLARLGAATRGRVVRDRNSYHYNAWVMNSDGIRAEANSYRGHIDLKIQCSDEQAEQIARFARQVMG